MSPRPAEQFSTVRTEGGLLPPGLLARVAAGDGTLGGLSTDAYHLAPGERFGEVINRSWLRLTGAWIGFRDALAAAPAGDPATGLTRDRWLLILFAELGYGRLRPERARIEVGGISFAVSHTWGPVPIHLVGAGVDLDRRSTGVAGAARSSPHSLVQELLNCDDGRLWGFVSNGLILRILRDNHSLTRQAFVEFDLQAMMDGEAYSDFVLLWLLAHESRVEADPPEGCWLERWSFEARTQGTRALDHLRDGVEAAIESLGTGFLAHPDNAALRAALRDGSLQRLDYYRQLLRVVYRMLFLLVAEERDLLLLPHTPAPVRRRYVEFYSIRRIRELAERRRGGPHGDLWTQLQTVTRLLGSDAGGPALGLPALGSFLFSDAATAVLAGATLANSHLLAAVRALSGRVDPHGHYRQRFDYRNLGVEELGSVYEGLLELHPEPNPDARTFALTHGGTERRATGSHYTPPGILKRVLDFALEPVITRVRSQADPEAALLDLRIVDPACGSGHFLIAAAHRIARAVASVRTGESEGTPTDIRHALRDVVVRCVYGVDLNPMAVELCRVALWLETLEPGKPLSFLDHHIRVGNSLLGVPLGRTVERNRLLVETRRTELEAQLGKLEGELRSSGNGDDAARVGSAIRALRAEMSTCVYDSWADAIPDRAFAATSEDARDLARKAVAENKRFRRSGQRRLGFVAVELPPELIEVFDRLGAGAEDSVAEVTVRAEAFEGVQRRVEYRHLVALANTWTSAFFWPLAEGAIAPPTQQWFLTLKDNPQALAPEMQATVEDIADDRHFFHFESAWPEVFTSERGGFDAVIGNPPYLGGPAISGTFGERTLKFLKLNNPARSGGRVDLAAYFLRRGFDLTRPGGELCFITTNSIAEGDTLAAGLGEVAGRWGGEVVDAVRNLRWEGDATVSVSVVHVHHGSWPGARSLDGQPTNYISPSLAANTHGTALPLEENRRSIAKGSNPLSTGFQLDPDAARRIMEDDPSNAEVVKPLYGSIDVSQTADLSPRRWIIDFSGRSLEDASTYRAPFDIVQRLVKPEREALADDGNFKVKRKAYRERWWQFAERSARLYERIADLGLDRVIVIPEVSKVMLPVFLPARGVVYFQSLFVLTSESDELFGLLSSSFHWLWAARSDGASTMRTDPRYHQERCFETFPRPGLSPAVKDAGRALDEYRSATMREHNEGMTDLYNRVNDPDDEAPHVQQLRELHAQLDIAAANAYGWSDMSLAHGVYRHERFGLRWTLPPETQSDLIGRLLELNSERAGSERSR